MNNYSFELKSGKKSIFIIRKNGSISGILPRAKLVLFLNFNGEMEISEKDEDYLQDELLRYGRERLFKFLTYRDRSVKETRQFLRELPLAPEFVDELISFCLEKKFLNDTRFAEMFVMSAKDSRISKREVIFKLKEKGVKTADIEHAIDEFYHETDEKQNLQELADYAFRRYRTEDRHKHKSKCIEYLIRKGYDYYYVKNEIDKLFGVDNDEYE
jgi:regulatory protein